ncbi:MAG TPA: protein translocase subunit SecF [Gammaproteobacteria bacterium]|nr:protein translocase subunit SecF [Gammaproteobacteria bacterium]
MKEIFKTTTTIDFMGRRKVAMGISGLVILIGIIALIVRGLNFGIDFTGGTLVEVAYQKPVAISDVRQNLKQAGMDKALVQYFGTSEDVLIRLPTTAKQSNAKLSNAVMTALRADNAKVEMRRVEFVGPQVGKELADQGTLAMLYALIGILIYVAWRFEWRFAVGSVVALVHDVLITVGFFSLFQLEFTLPVLAAILAVIGYSLNDTIVVFDRIRENFRKLRKMETAELMNRSINETLRRTVLTSLTTLLVLLALYFLGGEVMLGFALALIIGVVVGTYSSIFIASPITLMLGVSRENLTPVKKNDGGAGDMV